MPPTLDSESLDDYLGIGFKAFLGSIVGSLLMIPVNIVLGFLYVSFNNATFAPTATVVLAVVFIVLDILLGFIATGYALNWLYGWE